MSYEKVSQAKEIIIGTKQTIRALEDKVASEVVIAEDADLRIINEVEKLAHANNVPLVYVDSMKRLGKACGIDVGAATVALKK